MAPLKHISFTKVLVFFVLFLLNCCVLACAFTDDAQPLSNRFTNTRRMLEAIQEDQPPIKKTSTKNQTKPNTTSSTKNQTKLIKTTTTTSSSKNQTKFTNSAKNKTNKLIKPTNLGTPPTIKSQSSNSTTKLTKKPSDLMTKLPSSPKNNKTTTKPISPNSIELKPKNPDKNQGTKKKPNSEKIQKPTRSGWIDQEDMEDLVAEFRDLPFKFQETLFPDLEKISTTSKVYLNKANKEISRGFKPIVGKKYASTIASIVSFAFILIPLVLVSLIFNRIKAYFSLQKLLVFIQIYLSIYFSILCLSSLVTGLEPLRFFYATSQSTYVWLQVLQTLGYVLYLLLLLMYLVLVFSTDTGPGSKMLGLAQTFVGFAIGLHYYVTVFHRVVLHQPPKINWMVHGIYATCFLVICLLARADWRKKTYLQDGGDEGKKS